jgi:hypothetical protein
MPPTSPASTRWVLIDESSGAVTADGDSLTLPKLQQIADACSAQLNDEFAMYYGGTYTVRVGASASDIQPGELAYIFKPTIPEAPQASAYHDTDGKGAPVAFCAVTTCATILGKSGVSVDASHELLEAAGDPACNIMADNGQGELIAYEVCDPVEVCSYEGSIPGVQVSDFVLPAYWNPKSAGPFNFMSAQNLPGAVPPPGPMMIAPSAGGNGNYQIVESGGAQSEVFGLKGTPRKGKSIPLTSRIARRAGNRRISKHGALLVVMPDGTEEGPTRPATPRMPRMAPRMAYGKSTREIVQEAKQKEAKQAARKGIMTKRPKGMVEKMAKKALAAKARGETGIHTRKK